MRSFALSRHRADRGNVNVVAAAGFRNCSAQDCRCWCWLLSARCWCPPRWPVCSMQASCPCSSVLWSQHIHLVWSMLPTHIPTCTSATLTPSYSVSTCGDGDVNPNQQLLWWNIIPNYVLRSLVDNALHTHTLIRHKYSNSCSPDKAK